MVLPIDYYDRGIRGRINAHWVKWYGKFNWDVGMRQLDFDSGYSLLCMCANYFVYAASFLKLKKIIKKLTFQFWYAQIL